MLVLQLPVRVKNGAITESPFRSGRGFLSYAGDIFLISILCMSFYASSAHAYEQIPNQFDYKPQFENFKLGADFATHDLQTAPAPVPEPVPSPAPTPELTPSTTSPLLTPTSYGPTNTALFPSESQSGAERPFADEEQEQARLKRRKIKTLVAMEIAYQVLGVLDAAQTISCMNKTNCYELNPILGKRPSAAKIVGFKLASGLLHYSAFRHYIKKEHYKSAMVFELVSLTVQGVVCGLNFRHAF